MTVLTSLLSRLRPGAARVPLARVIWSHAPERVYAIGDVHGCLDQLRALEALIVEDARNSDGEKYLVLLGDYVDRGPKSAQVIDHLLAAPPAGFKRICLRGNHEDMMLRAATEGIGIPGWLSFGGEETMVSYGVPAHHAGLRSRHRRVQQQLLRAYLPREHVAFLETLPVALEMPGYAFVHAGVRPGLTLAQQRDEDLMWIRDPFVTSTEDFGAVVVHGHTPVAHPVHQQNRIAVHTGCYQTGRLSACCLSPRDRPRFLEAR
jgi:serine/threonine protein phosphatase 1